MTTIRDAAAAAAAPATRTARPDLSPTTRRVLDALQAEFPLVPRPYEAVGGKLGLSEAEVIDSVLVAREAGVVRQLSAIYDTKALGYSSALVAMQVDAEQLTAAAAVVNAHPGVSHNYRRNHDFNMWFTIAMPPGHDLNDVIQKLHELAGAESTRPMPTLELFKIAVTLDMSGTREADARGAPEYTQAHRDAAVDESVDADDVAYVLATQRDIATVPEPFAIIADELGWSVERVLDHAHGMRRRGLMRRFAAILNHRVAGFRANGMAVWNVPEERRLEFGQFVAGFRNVSHCYLRPTYPDWPYSIFSMLHHPKVAGVEETAQKISEQTGIGDYRVLYSSTEFKKIRLPYFVPEYDMWRALCEQAAAEQGLR